MLDIFFSGIAFSYGANPYPPPIKSLQAFPENAPGNTKDGG